MLRSKSRSGAFDFGGKSQPSVLSRTFSASKICRGDPSIDRDAVITVERRPSARIVSSSESQLVRVTTMQRQMGRIEEELQLTKAQLEAAGEERDRALDELRESKLVAYDANMRASDSLSVLAELKTVKELLSNSQKELTIKEKNIESMKGELEQAKQIEIKLAERDSSLSRLNEELRNVKASEARALGLFLQREKRIEELEEEVERGKQSESKLFESVVSQSKQLEVNKIELKESKLQIASLREKMEELQISSQISSKELNGFQKSENIDSTRGALENPNSALQLEGMLRNELKAAIEAEEKSAKAMEDLALALKEVATESNQAKEKLSLTELELEHVKGEAEQLKVMLRSSEEKYEKLLNEAKREKELHQNTADRLRLEAEESLLAWNGKEMGFVGVIKRAEEESALAQQDLKAARDEKNKLRDILKQALNEANVAKEAASIARDENSQLKDLLTKEDEALTFLTRENERLRIDEDALQEKIKELKQLLSKNDDNEESGMESALFMSPESVSDDRKEETAIKKGFNLDLHDKKLYNKDYDDNDKLENEDPVKPKALKGSIFDPSTESPRSEPHTPKPVTPHRRKSSSALTDDGETVKSDDFEHLDGSHFEDADGERNSHRRRRSALLRRFGDLIMRASIHRREPPVVTDQ